MSRFVTFAFALTLVVTLVAGAGPASGAAWQAASPTSADCPTTTPEENEAIVARWYDEVLNGHDVSVLEEILVENVDHESGAFPDEPGPRFIINALLAAFPDIAYTTDEAISTDNVVVVRWTATGTHTGEFQGHAPTGRTATWTGINIFEIDCGRIAGVITELDAIGRLEQLGLLP